MRAHGAHSVRVYATDDELVPAVAEHVAAGRSAGEPAVLVATPEHVRLVLDRLEREGVGTDRVVVADAAETLAAILDGGELPSPQRFEEVVGGLLDETRRRFGRRPPRVFGEMVNLFVAAGRPEAAFELERLWNRLGARRSFSLLCGYRLDVFDAGAQRELLPQVCGSHDLVGVPDDPRLERAVDGALVDALGPEDAELVRAVVATDSRRSRIGPGQLALMWVARNMPFRAGGVLAAARAGYAADG